MVQTCRELALGLVMGMGWNCVDFDAFVKEVISEHWFEWDGHFVG